MVGRTFTLEEAERLRRQLEPAIRRLRDLYERHRQVRKKMEALREWIRWTGGYYALSETSAIASEINRWERRLQKKINEIQKYGIIIRDLEAGLVDFPGELDGKPIFWCWKLDEATILYYHEPEAGFAGRKPIPSHRMKAVSSADSS